MKLTFDISWFNQKAAFAIAAHNRRDEEAIKDNLKTEGMVGGIDPRKIKDNIIHLDNFQSVNALLDNRKVIGGRQKVADEYCGFVISIGNKDETLPKETNKEFLAKACEWIENRFGGKYLLQTIEHWDEVTPKLKVMIANVTDYQGDDMRKVGKVYVGAKRRFGVETAQNIFQVKQHFKDLQNTFYKEVCLPFETFGVEAPNFEEIGKRGKKSQSFYVQEKNKKALLETKRLEEKNKLIRTKINERLVDLNALQRMLGPDEWNNLMKRLKISKEQEKEKLIKVRGREK